MKTEELNAFINNEIIDALNKGEINIKTVDKGKFRDYIRCSIKGELCTVQLINIDLFGNTNNFYRLGAEKTEFIPLTEEQIKTLKKLANELEFNNIESAKVDRLQEIEELKKRQAKLEKEMQDEK